MISQKIQQVLSMSLCTILLVRGNISTPGKQDRLYWGVPEGQPSTLLVR